MEESETAEVPVEAVIDVTEEIQEPAEEKTSEIEESKEV